MVYLLDVDDNLVKAVQKLKKKDPVSHGRILKKTKEILENPELGKPLSNSMKDIRRVHIGHFVLTYKIDYGIKKVTLVDYEHHDKVYKYPHQ